MSPLIRYMVSDCNGEPMVVRDTPEEAAAYMVERAKWLQGQSVSAYDRRMTLSEIHERPVNAGPPESCVVKNRSLGTVAGPQ